MYMYNYTYTYIYMRELAHARPPMSSISLVAERISARQYKSGSILGIYVRMCTYVRTFGHLRRRVRVGVARAGSGA